MSKEMVKSYHERTHQRQGSRGQPEGQESQTNSSQAAVQVQWEKEVPKKGPGQEKDSRSAGGQDLELLEEIESMCAFNSGFNSSLPPPQIRLPNTPHHPVQGNAADQS